MSRGGYEIQERYRVNEVTGCWDWLLALNIDGYGHTTYNYKTYRAHRFYYEQRFGKIAKGMTLNHKCKNKKCVNPEHMEVMTFAENARIGNLGLKHPNRKYKRPV